MFFVELDMRSIVHSLGLARLDSMLALSLATTANVRHIIVYGIKAVVIVKIVHVIEVVGDVESTESSLISIISII